MCNFRTKYSYVSNGHADKKITINTDISGELMHLIQAPQHETLTLQQIPTS